MILSHFTKKVEFVDYNLILPKVGIDSSNLSLFKNPYEKFIIVMDS